MKNKETGGETGGPAFPVSTLSLRDYFAGQALTTFMASEAAMRQLHAEVNACESETERRAVTINHVLAKRCYMLADAMLAERVKERKGD